MTKHWVWLPRTPRFLPSSETSFESKVLEEHISNCLSSCLEDPAVHEAVDGSLSLLVRKEFRRFLHAIVLLPGPDRAQWSEDHLSDHGLQQLAKRFFPAWEHLVG
jgi:hypothetical protein